MIGAGLLPGRSYVSLFSSQFLPLCYKHKIYSPLYLPVLRSTKIQPAMRGSKHSMAAHSAVCLQTALNMSRMVISAFLCRWEASGPSKEHYSTSIFRIRLKRASLLPSSSMAMDMIPFFEHVPSMQRYDRSDFRRSLLMKHIHGSNYRLDPLLAYLYSIPTMKLNRS